MGEKWVVWHRPTERERDCLWQRVCEGATERDAITLSNGMRLPGDVMVLADGQDPNVQSPMRGKEKRSRVSDVEHAGEDIPRCAHRGKGLAKIEVLVDA